MLHAAVVDTFFQGSVVAATMSLKMIQFQVGLKNAILKSRRRISCPTVLR